MNLRSENRQEVISAPDDSHPDKASTQQGLICVAPKPALMSRGDCGNSVLKEDTSILNEDTATFVKISIASLEDTFPCVVAILPLPILRLILFEVRWLNTMDGAEEVDGAANGV